MIGKAVGWFIGQAPSGGRKVVVGMWAIMLVWSFIMWAPGIQNPGTMEAVRVKGLDVIWLIVAAVVAGNGIEHGAKAIGARVASKTKTNE